jgi:LL-diaminopimelate aminotransferase
MIYLNDNYLELPGSYLFSEIAKRVRTYREVNPNADVISLGIGDVTQPLPKAVIAALHRATDEMANIETMRGYAPDHGYEFLRNAIADNDFKARGVDIDPSEIFVSDGAKSDTGNIGDILNVCNRIAVTDPVYPVYVDTNAMAGRLGKCTENVWEKLVYLPCTAENGFIPALPSEQVNVVYLCYPNNPVGTTLTKAQLKEWVDYAIKNNVLLMFDAAYEAFISEDDVPHSIYEIEGAKQVAIEFRSFSKTAGFTGLRCGYTVVPKDLTAQSQKGEKASLNSLWMRRQSTKFNGTAYIVQRAAEAVYSDEGKAQVKEIIDYYKYNAGVIKKAMQQAGLEAYGGVNAPYVWVKTPDGMSSWEFFDWLLNEKQVIGTPGAGFGKSGEGYLRFSAFGQKDATLRAVERIIN